jgi:hypothetical protein
MFFTIFPMPVSDPVARISKFGGLSAAEMIFP